MKLSGQNTVKGNRKSTHVSNVNGQFVSLSAGLHSSQGGKFEHGFMSGFVSSLGGTAINSSNMNIGAQVAMSAVIGGTAEKLGGGKFANGAVTGAYVMMFNHLATRFQTRFPDLDFYYDAINGMELPDGTVMLKNDIVFSFVDDPTINASYGGFKDGKHHVNLNIGDYEVTVDNVRALVVHEVYGHGIMGYDINTNHHLAYFSSVDSKYWDATTLRFKQHVVNQMWIRYYHEVGNQRMPQPYQSNFDKYQSLYD